jgi:histidine triad (HIT) family protein
MPAPQLTEEQRKELEEKLKNMSPEELQQFQKQQCIFCQIISGKIPSKKVYEDDTCIVILDINPAAKGHLLIIPKEHYVIMPQVPDNELGNMFSVAKSLSQTLLKSLKVDGTNVFVANGPAAGQRSQHFILHLIPRSNGDGLLQVEEKLLNQEMLDKIKGAVEGKLNEILGVKTKEVEKEVSLEELEEESEAQKPEEPQEPEVKEEKPKKAKPKQEKKKEDVSLDDIANLFK